MKRIFSAFLCFVVLTISANALPTMEDFPNADSSENDATSLAKNISAIWDHLYHLESEVHDHIYGSKRREVHNHNDRDGTHNHTHKDVHGPEFDTDHRRYDDHHGHETDQKHGDSHEHSSTGGHDYHGKNQLDHGSDHKHGGSHEHTSDVSHDHHNPDHKHSHEHTSDSHDHHDLDHKHGGSHEHTSDGSHDHHDLDHKHGGSHEHTSDGSHAHHDLNHKHSHEHTSDGSHDHHDFDHKHGGSHEHTSNGSHDHHDPDHKHGCSHEHTSGSSHVHHGPNHKHRDSHDHHGPYHKHGGCHGHETDDSHDHHRNDHLNNGPYNKHGVSQTSHHGYQHHHHSHSHSHGPGSSHTKAYCQLEPNTEIPDSKVKGSVLMSQQKSGKGPVYFEVNVDGFPAEEVESNRAHGFHVHQHAVVNGGCSSAGPHLNLQNLTHGAPFSSIRHEGDLGNIVVDREGSLHGYKLSDSIITLVGENSIINRSIVVHLKEDDFGLGGNEESLRTGNAGARLACCSIRAKGDRQFQTRSSKIDTKPVIGKEPLIRFNG